MKHIAIVGAGGHTHSSLNLIRQYFSEANIYLYDDAYALMDSKKIDNIKLVGTINSISQDLNVFLSIGDNCIRQAFFEKFLKQLITHNLIHKTAYCESNLVIGIANQIFAKVYINAFVKIGNNNIINTGAIVEHEVKIGNHNHISVGVKICGQVTIGNNCMIGAGATIIDELSICDNVTIGAGAVVINNITQSGTYVGVPAKLVFN